jgi:hypothetical protein
VGDAQEQHPAVGDDRSGRRADEAHLRIGQQPQDLVGPDGVQGGQPRVEHDGDLHDGSFLVGQAAGGRGRRGRPACPGAGVLVSHVRNGKFTETWQYSEDQYAADEFLS